MNYANSAGTAGFATNAGNADNATNLSGIGGWTSLKNYIDSKASSSSMTPDWDAAVTRFKWTTYSAYSNGFVVLKDLKGHGGGVFDTAYLLVNGVLIAGDSPWTENLTIPLAKGDSYGIFGEGDEAEKYLWIPAK